MKGGMQGMMKQIQQMQAQMEKVQAELANKTVSEESGGGIVKATVNGKKELISIEIDNEMINSGDKEMLEDLVVAAINKALDSAGKMAEEDLGGVTKGMIPPGMNIPDFKLLIAEPLQIVIDELSKLPAIGRKTALRIALHLLKNDPEIAANLVKAITELKEKIRFCSICFNISVEETCDICRNAKRDKSIICVVEEASDIIAIEKSNEFSGQYHVLGGVLSPLQGTTTDSLKIKELVERIAGGEIKEIILALNPDTEGDTTSLYLSNMLKQYDLKISRIARGIPIGGDLEFADEATIGRALLGRVNL